MIYSYARVSTGEQGRPGTVSIPEQLRKNRAVAQLHGVDRFDVLEFADDGVSGATPLSSRPEGSKLVSQVGRGDTVIAAKLDRIFRSSRDAINTLEQFRKQEVDVILVAMGSEPIGKSAISNLFFEMLAAFAAFELSLIRERTREGQLGKRARNGHLGGPPPYGWRAVGKGRDSVLEPEPTEQKVVALIMRRWETRTQKQIVAELDQCGYRTRDGLPFGYVQVARIHDREQRRAQWQIAS